jgi:protein-tyrosine phosphatase
MTLALMRELSESETRLYVHCAQGHGRTGMIAALLLLIRDPDLSVADAVLTVKKIRLGVALASEQLAFVELLSESYRSSRDQTLPHHSAH